MSEIGAGSRIKGTMTHLLRSLACLALVLTACSIRVDDDPTCRGDHCVCTAADDCVHTCADGAPECHIQGQSGQPVDVQCNNNASCHVECSTSSSCEVDCGGSADCHVTCPPSGCTVTSCSGPECVVACGLTGRATHVGTTATCP